MFLVMDLLIQKEGQLDLTKVFKNGYFTKVDTSLLDLTGLVKLLEKAI